jgi:hypothetical protein
MLYVKLIKRKLDRLLTFWWFVCSSLNLFKNWLQLFLGKCASNCSDEGGRNENLDLAGQVVQACNPSTQEAEAGGSQVWGQTALHSKFQDSLGYTESVSKKPKRGKKRKCKDSGFSMSSGTYKMWGPRENIVSSLDLGFFLYKWEDKPERAQAISSPSTCFWCYMNMCVCVWK